MTYESRPREFLYVDLQRVRSLLSQLGGGLVEQVKAFKGDTLQGEAQARILGIGGKGGYSHDWRSEESRSLQDMTFSVFEDAAEEMGMIRDLEESFFRPDSWDSGLVHESIRPSEIIRLTCDLQILDGELFRARLERFLKMIDSLIRINPPEIKQGASQKQKDSVLQAAKKEIMGGLDERQIEAIWEFIESFLGDTIAMRALPCGTEHLEYAFNGALLGRNEYIQEEREHLFSRYGTDLRDWVCVLHVATIPHQGDQASDFSNLNFMLSSGEISRAKTERGAAELLAILEGVGILDGPRWPTISVTPLGIYRDVHIPAR
jgi:hypothetical protein